MMRVYDVVLSYSMGDVRAARALADSLHAAGLQIFDLAEVPAGANIQAAVMRAIAESGAMVVVASQDTVNNPSLAVQMGAAWAWNKPIYLVSSDDRSLRELPLELSRVYTLAQIDDIIYEIKQGLRPLSQTDRDALVDAYRSLGVPTDRLIQEPAAIDRLARLYERQRHRSVPGERLMRELIRMRKQGRLPRLRAAV